MVCAPLVEYLYRDEKISINVCSQFKDEADQMASQFPGIKSTYLNVMDNPSLLKELCGNSRIYLDSIGKTVLCHINIELIGKSDIVVSLLPYVLHGVVAEKCIEVFVQKKLLTVI